MGNNLVIEKQIMEINQFKSLLAKTERSLDVYIFNTYKYFLGPKKSKYGPH